MFDRVRRLLVALLVGLMPALAWGQSRLPPLEPLIVPATHHQPAEDGPQRSAESGEVLELPAAAIQPAPASQREGGLTLSELEQMALANNPHLAVADARLAEAHGNWLQVGLKPNPVLGYIADDIGQGGGPGAQGIYAQQRFVTGGKLGLNREVAAQRIARAEDEYDAARLRVLTDVRRQFYRTLLAQRRLQMTQELVDISQKAADTAKRLWDAKEGLRVDYVRALIEVDRLQISLAQAEANHRAAFRELAAVVGLPNLTATKVHGEIEANLPQHAFEEAVGRLIASNPLVLAARADVERACWAIRRAEAEVIPDLQTGMEVKYEPVNDRTLVMVQAGVALPLWDRNQGGIQQARANYTAAVSRQRQLELRLRGQLARAFRDYDAARARARQFSENIVPRSQTTVELAEAGLAAGELNYLDLLTARRNFFRANLDYLSALEDLWVAAQRIEGMLLEESLAN